MILVGCPFDHSTTKDGVQIDIDDDRSTAVFMDAQGNVLIGFRNGSRKHAITLTREAAEALYAVLGDSLGVLL